MQSALNNHKLLLELAEESGLVFNLEMTPEKIYSWHKKKIYAFAELVHQNRDKLFTSDKADKA